MKRTKYLFIVSLVLCLASLTLYACYTNKEKMMKSQNTLQMLTEEIVKIDSNKVSIKDQKTIENLRMMYDSLMKKDKQKFAYYQKLLELEKKLDECDDYISHAKINQISFYSFYKISIRNLVLARFLFFPKKRAYMTNEMRIM